MNGIESLTVATRSETFEGLADSELQHFVQLHAMLRTALAPITAHC